MAELDASEQASVLIRSSTLKVLEAVATIRNVEPWQVLDDVVEQARLGHLPKPKPAPGASRGRGRRAES